MVLAVLIGLHEFLGTGWWWLLPVVLAYKIALIIGSASINSGFYTKVYCEGKTTEKEIAITFDDGPTSYTSSILRTLAEYKAPATFFVIGKNIKSNESLIKQAISEGHTIGNHTFSHSFFIDFKNSKGFKKELNQTSDAIYAVTGKRMKFFRPPYGVTTPHLTKAARELDYKIIGWSIRSLDTTNDKGEIILKRILNQLKPGAVVLFHDTSEKTNRVLKQVLQFAKENQFRITSLEKLLQLPPYQK
jgi:peptidoglycan/xylan/chitin deacetylase (PgdA/CDA1 family)